MRTGGTGHPVEDTLLAGSAVILCTGGLDVIRKEACFAYRTISVVRLCWELEEPKGPEGVQKASLADWREAGQL